MDRRNVYWKEAFIRPDNLGGFVVALFVCGIFAALGLWPAFFLPVAGEAVYLVWRSRSPAFRRWVQREKGFGGALFDADERERLAGELGADERVRYQRFERTYRDIAESVETTGRGARRLIEESLCKIEGMRDGFLRLLHARTRSTHLLRRTEEKVLMAEAQELRGEIGKAEGEARGIKEKSLSLVVERLSHLDEVRREREITDAQLEMMEATLALLCDKAATLWTPTEIESQADLAVRNMTDAENIAGRMDSLLMQAHAREQGLRD